MSDAVIIKTIELIATLATLVIGGIISIKLGKLHKQINSRMDQLIVQTQLASKAEGKIEGKAEEKEKHITLEAQIAPQVIPGEATHLKIVEGDIKVTTETKKKK